MASQLRLFGVVFLASFVLISLVSVASASLRSKLPHAYFPYGSSISMNNPPQVPEHEHFCEVSFSEKPNPSSPLRESIAQQIRHHRERANPSPLPSGVDYITVAERWRVWSAPDTPSQVIEAAARAIEIWGTVLHAPEAIDVLIVWTNEMQMPFIGMARPGWHEVDQITRRITPAPLSVTLSALKQQQQQQQQRPHSGRHRSHGDATIDANVEILPLEMSDIPLRENESELQRTRQWNEYLQDLAQINERAQRSTNDQPHLAPETVIPDIIMWISSLVPWYYGVEPAVPFSQIDLTTVVLHEVGHGLGFQGGCQHDDYVPHIGRHVFDEHIVAFNEPRSRKVPLVTVEAVVNTTHYIQHAQPALTRFFSLFMNVSLPESEGQDLPLLFTPNPFQLGSSIYHLDESRYTTENSLMTPMITNGEAQRDPGPLTVAIFRAIGWPTRVLSIKLANAPSTSAVVNQPLAVVPEVVLLDASNQIVPLNGVQLSIETVIGDRDQISTHTATTVNGRATFDGLTFTEAGTYVIHCFMVDSPAWVDLPPIMVSEAPAAVVDTTAAATEAPTM